MSKPEFLTTKEARERIESRTGISVSRNTFYGWLKAEVIKRQRLGKRFYISTSDLDAFLSDFPDRSKLLADR